MSTPTSAPIPAGATRDATLYESLALVGLALLLPGAFHFLPSWDDSPLGARFLPIFYAPLLAVFLRMPLLGAGVAAASPWLNHLLFGMPPLPLALIFTLELLVFTAWLFLFVSRLPRQAWMGPAAYLLAKPATALLLLLFPQILPAAQPLRFIAQSVTNAWPGLLVLTLLAALAGAYARRNGLDK